MKKITMHFLSPTKSIIVEQTNPLHALHRITKWSRSSNNIHYVLLRRS